LFELALFVHFPSPRHFGTTRDILGHLGTFAVPKIGFVCSSRHALLGSFLDQKNLPLPSFCRRCAGGAPDAKHRGKTFENLKEIEKYYFWISILRAPLSARLENQGLLRCWDPEGGHSEYSSTVAARFRRKLTFRRMQLTKRHSRIFWMSSFRTPLLRRKYMRSSVVTVLLMLSGCQLFYLGSGGKQHPVWTKQEIVEWYGKFRQPPRFMYRGSDAEWHYFITRPIDDFVFIQVDRKELVVPEEHPCSQQMEFGYYPVDPSNGFRKAED